MRLLHGSSMFAGGGGGGRAPRRGASGSPRAPPPPRRQQQLFSRSDSINERAPRHQQQLFSKSDSIKKRSGAAKGSKRARLRAGLAAALHDLRLAGRRHKRGSSSSTVSSTASDATRRTGFSSQSPQVGLQVPTRRAEDSDGTAGPPCAAAAPGSPVGTAAGGGAVLLVLLLLALLCVVALGRAPAVCCCTCAALMCRGGLCGSVAQARGGYGGSCTDDGAAGRCR